MLSQDEAAVQESLKTIPKKKRPQLRSVTLGEQCGDSELLQLQSSSSAPPYISTSSAERRASRAQTQKLKQSQTSATEAAGPRTALWMLQAPSQAVRLSHGVRTAGVLFSSWEAQYASTVAAYVHAFPLFLDPLTQQRCA